MLDKLTIEDFSTHLNHTFQVHFEVGEKVADPFSLALALVEVSQLGEKQADEGQRQSFSILFEGPSEPALSQKIYHFEHPGLGRLDLFLVPVGPKDGSMLYEVVFN